MCVALIRGLAHAGPEAEPPSRQAEARASTSPEPGRRATRPGPSKSGVPGDRLVPVNVDIRPGICPNHLRIESPLTIPIAILGTVYFEPARINAETARLYRDGVPDGVKPASWVYDDVGTPLIGGVCACHKLKGDGLDDLEFQFLIEDVVSTLGLATQSGYTIKAHLRGQLVTGEDFEGVDCIAVVGGEWVEEDMESEIGMLTNVGELPTTGPFRFGYYTSVSDRVTFSIYDVGGRLVAKLVDMDMAPGIYNAMWDGTRMDATTRDREKVPAGIYFARVSNSWAWDTRKIIITQ